MNGGYPKREVCSEPFSYQHDVVEKMLIEVQHQPPSLYVHSRRKKPGKPTKPYGGQTYQPRNQYPQTQYEPALDHTLNSVLAPPAGPDFGMAAPHPVMSNPAHNSSSTTVNSNTSDSTTFTSNIGTNSTTATPCTAAPAKLGLFDPFTPFESSYHPGSLQSSPGQLFTPIGDSKLYGESTSIWGPSTTNTRIYDAVWG